jgi:hypothetical protein
MRYMLMMHAPRGTGDYQVTAGPRRTCRRTSASCTVLNKDLTDAGELVGAEGLDAPGQAKVVRVGANGAPAVTDGPFAETKEFLAGFWMVDVDGPERALRDRRPRLGRPPAPAARRSASRSRCAR